MLLVIIVLKLGISEVNSVTVLKLFSGVKGFGVGDLRALSNELNNIPCDIRKPTLLTHGELTCEHVTSA